MNNDSHHPHEKHLPSLRRNISWTFVGNLVYAACQWAILVVLARMGTTSIVGQFALALAVTGPVVMLASMQLRWVQATDSRREFDFANCAALRLVCLVVAMIAVVIITQVVGYDQQTTWIVLAVATAKSIEAICDVIYGWYQQNERMELIAWSLMVRGPLSVVAVAVGYHWFDGLLGGCIALAIAWATILLAYDIPQARKFSRTLNASRSKAVSNHRQDDSLWNPQQMRHIFVKALPVGLTAGVVALLVNIPRYFVEEHFGTDELGIFAAMAYVLLAAETFVRAVNQSAMPRLSHYLNESNLTGFRDVLQKLVGLGAACGAVATFGAWLLGPFFLHHVYGPEYATSPAVLTLMVAGAGLSFVLRPAEVGLRSMRRFNVLLIVNFVSLPLLVAMTWWAVPKYGLWGAAMAMFVQVAVHGVITLFVFATLAPKRVTEKEQTSTSADPLPTLSAHAEPIRGPHFRPQVPATASPSTSPPSA